MVVVVVAEVVVVVVKVVVVVVVVVVLVENVVSVYGRSKGRIGSSRRIGSSIKTNGSSSSSVIALVVVMV
jgi:hypothetical protein